MKKLYCLMLALLFGAGMMSCVKSEEAQRVEDMIYAIGEVTTDDEAALKEATRQYNMLPEGQQRRVENASMLEEKIAMLYQLMADEIEVLIDEIGSVSLDPGCIERINTASIAYEDFNDKYKNNVSNYSVLVMAEELLLSLKIGYVEDAINKIGTVTRASDDAVRRAREAFELYPEVRDSLSNYELLEKATERLIAEKIRYVEDAINDIGVVNLDSGTLIKAAEAAYNLYKDDIEGLVSNFADLVRAKEQLVLEKIKAVETEISKIGNVTLSSGTIIKNARETYNLYNKAIKDAGKAVSNEHLLFAAEDTYDNLRMTEGELAYKRLRKKYDSSSGTYWYESTNKPEHVDIRTYISCYIGVRNENVWLRFISNYYEENWVFFKKMTFNVDGVTTTMKFDYFDVERDNGGGYVWETYDKAPTDADYELLWSIADSTVATVRFEGDEKYFNYTISSGDKKGIRDVLFAYEYLCNLQSVDDAVLA